MELRGVLIKEGRDRVEPQFKFYSYPYSPTNIALYFINRGPFYSSILGL